MKVNAKVLKRQREAKALAKVKSISASIKTLAFMGGSAAREARVSIVTGSQWHNRLGGYVKV